MKNTIRAIFKICIAGVGAILVLSAVCLIYSYDGIHVKNESGATDYVWKNSQYKANMKEGFSWMRMDEDGYNNAFMNIDSVDILLMGSSHMEGVQVKRNENTGYLLNELLPDYNTYNIGMSGHTIYRCVDNLENALNVYQPKKYVVIVIDTVCLSEQSMTDVMEGTAEPIPSYDKGIVYLAQQIPAVKMLYKQLSDWVDASDFEVKAQETSDKSLIVEEFLKKISSESNNAGVVPMIVYQPKQSISDNGSIVYEYNIEELQEFSDKCKSENIVFIDMTEGFEELYERKQVLAHGFSNTKVGVGHLNKHGHEAIAKQIVIKIKELETR